MDDIFVARLMTSPVRTVAPDTLVEDAGRTMLEHEVGSLVVTDADGYLEGILTTTDFVRIVAERQPKDETPVSAYMSTDVVAADAQDPVRDVADLILERGFHHLPVVDDDEGVIGIISTTDLASYLSSIEAPSPA